MKPPKEVVAAAAGLVKMYGPYFSFLGERNGAMFFKFDFPEDEKTGFPFVYQYVKGEPVLELTGYEALDTISLFTE